MADLVSDSKRRNLFKQRKKHPKIAKERSNVHWGLQSVLEQYGSAAMAGESNNGFPIWPLDGERMNEYFF